jgi:hypothetical protein
LEYQHVKEFGEPGDFAVDEITAAGDASDGFLEDLNEIEIYAPTF